MHPLAEIRTHLAQVLEKYTDDPAPYVEMIKPAQDSRFGDFQANCAMPLGKKIGKNPRDLAAEVVEQLELDDLCENIEVAGPGFINLKLKSDWMTHQLEGMHQDDRLSVPQAENPKQVVIDYSSPNVAKPMHVGHLRSTVIGNTLSRILKFLGHHVQADNHLGDWGTQFGMIIYGYKNFLNEENFKEHEVTELTRLYKLVNQLTDFHQQTARIPQLEENITRLEGELVTAEQDADPKDKKSRKKLGKLKNDVAAAREALASAQDKIAAVKNDSELLAKAEAHPDIARLAREETAKLHQGDAENQKLWNEFLPLCIEAIDEIYQQLDVEFDLVLGESFYQPMLAGVVEDLKTNGMASESQGAICVFHQENEAPFIIQKTDGAYTYATTDLATIKYRADELKADTVLYVVDARQGEHFQLLFETARKWGYDQLDYRHISFGTVLGDDKKPMKTRSGDNIGLESLIDESIQRARQIVDAGDDSKPAAELDEESRQAVAKIVGTGAIKYADLSHNRESDYVFNWEKMLATNGDTATYIQYAYARICGIFRQVGSDRAELRANAPGVIFTKEAERGLGLQLLRFSEAVQSVIVDYRPNILTQYLFDTSKAFSTFFDQCHVKNEEDPAIQQSRLVFCDLTARVLKQGLDLLGIQTSEKM